MDAVATNTVKSRTGRNLASIICFQGGGEIVTLYLLKIKSYTVVNYNIQKRVKSYFILLVWAASMYSTLQSRVSNKQSFYSHSFDSLLKHSLIKCNVLGSFLFCKWIFNIFLFCDRQPSFLLYVEKA